MRAILDRLAGRSRRAGVLAAVAVIGTLALIPAPVVAQTATIQPGASIVNESGGQCTLNWVYDGTGAHAGEVFVGTAAHCVDRVGESITLQTGTFGQPVLVIGEVAFISPNLDYSLIRVREENLGFVSPAMKGHPEIPTGVSTTETANLGDIIQFSGNGVGFHATTLTQEERVGVLHFNDGTEWSALGPVTFGDSGGPAGDITDGNKALGIVTVLCVGTTCSGAGGVSLEGLLQDAAAFGFTVAVRTV
ncbi:MAG TPA: hypothetical protein VHL78_00665 [Actinomycetota bacterium]|nr:hypothetical protein [Actinomycetota bacterium]